MSNTSHSSDGSKAITRLGTLPRLHARPEAGGDDPRCPTFDLASTDWFSLGQTEVTMAPLFFSLGQKKIMKHKQKVLLVCVEAQVARLAPKALGRLPGHRDGAHQRVDRVGSTFHKQANISLTTVTTCSQKKKSTPLYQCTLQAVPFATFPCFLVLCGNQNHCTPRGTGKRKAFYRFAVLTPRKARRGGLKPARVDIALHSWLL